MPVASDTSPAHFRQRNFPSRVKKRLIDRRLTVTELAERLGYARNTVSQAINHCVNPALCERIAEFLDIKI